VSNKKKQKSGRSKHPPGMLFGRFIVFLKEAVKNGFFNKGLWPYLSARKPLIISRFDSFRKIIQVDFSTCHFNHFLQQFLFLSHSLMLSKGILATKANLEKIRFLQLRLETLWFGSLFSNLSSKSLQFTVVYYLSIIILAFPSSKLDFLDLPGFDNFTGASNSILFLMFFLSHFTLLPKILSISLLLFEESYLTLLQISQSQIMTNLKPKNVVTKVFYRC